MKTAKILFILTLALFSFSACETENGEIFVQFFVDYEEGETPVYNQPVSIYVDNSQLVNTLTDPYDNTPMFPSGDVQTPYQVRTNILIYNEYGVLIDNFTVYRANFNSEASYSLELEPGSYTAVAITDLSYNNTDNVWKIIDQNDLANLSITFANKYAPGYMGIVAARQQDFEVSNNSVNLDISPTHLGAYTVIYFNNFDYTKYRYLYYVLEFNPDDYRFSTRVYSRKLSLNNTEELDFEGKYNAYYVYKYLLPKTNLTLQYVTMDVNRNYMTTMNSATFNSTANQHRQLNVNVTTFTSSSSALAPPAPSAVPAFDTATLREKKENSYRIKTLLSSEH